MKMSPDSRTGRLTDQMNPFCAELRDLGTIHREKEIVIQKKSEKISPKILSFFIALNIVLPHFHQNVYKCLKCQFLECLWFKLKNTRQFLCFFVGNSLKKGAWNPSQKWVRTRTSQYQNVWTHGLKSIARWTHRTHPWGPQDSPRSDC